MTRAWIDGRPTSVEEAVEASAALLSKSRLPLITGRLGGDVSPLRPMATIAAASGGVLDHLESGAVMPSLTAIRDAGMIVATPGEARRRADRVLVLGADPFAASEPVFSQLFSVEPDIGARTKGKGREIVLLGPDAPGRFSGATGEVRAIPCPQETLADAVAILCAALAGRPFADGPFAEGAARALAGWLADAGYAAIVFDATAFDALGIETIAGLVSDLNKKSRAGALPLTASDAYGAALAATWATGFPLRTGFGRGASEHDPVLCEGERLLAFGEVDALLVVGDGPLPEASGGDAVPVVALTHGEPPAGVRVAFDVARPGAGHGTIRHEPRFGSFVHEPATHERGPDGAPSAAAVLTAIAEALGDAHGKAAA